MWSRCSPTSRRGCEPGSVKVDTYIVGFALPFGVNPSQLDTIAAAGGTSTAYNATDQAQLISAFDQIFADILHRSGAASAVALNSSSLAANNWLYQAKFDIGWAGRLLAYPIDPVTGALAALCPTGTRDRVWMRMDCDMDRRIITYKPSTQGRHSIPLAGGPDDADRDRARRRRRRRRSTPARRGLPILAARPGSTTCAATTASRARDPVTQFRPRNSDLGDIVDSGPFYVGQSDQHLSRSELPRIPPEPGDARRASRSSTSAPTTASARLPRVGWTRSARPIVPSAVYGNLSKLTGQGYVHRYYVDGSPTSPTRRSVRGARGVPRWFRVWARADAACSRST